MMLLLKRREIHKGKESLFSKMGKGSDHLFHAVFSKVNEIVRYINKHTVIALVQWVTFHVLLRVRKIYVNLKHSALQNPHGKKMIDAVRGRGEVKDHGASFYLRRISQGKGK